MIARISGTIHEWTGWCPNPDALKVPSTGARTGTGQTGIADLESPQPGTSPATITVHHWMTATALVILLATCFVGGNPWWPFFVGGVLLAGLVYWYYCQGQEVR